MWLCQEINEVHYTHHIFYASLWHVYCLHRNAALFKEKKENNSEAARIRCPLFQKQQFPGDLLFFLNSSISQATKKKPNLLFKVQRTIK